MFVYDTETVGDKTALPLLPKPEPPANYKSSEAIDKWMAEAVPKQIARMSLIPSECRIVALAWDADGVMNVRLCYQKDEYERVALREFWAAFSNAHDPVGYNVNFDLPVLMTRSRILGVTHPRIELRKYGTAGIRDLMLELSFGGINDFRSLNFWCKRFNLTVPEDPNTGKDIAALVDEDTEEAWDQIRQHVTADVLKTRILAEYLNLL